MLRSLYSTDGALCISQIISSLARLLLLFTVFTAKSASVMGQKCHVIERTKMYADPDRRSQIVLRLEPGNQLIYSETFDDYFRVVYQNSVLRKTGYVHNSEVACNPINKAYFAWVKTKDKKLNGRGRLISAGESDVTFVLNTKFSDWLLNADGVTQKFAVEDIDALKVRKRSRSLSPLLSGLAGSFILGIVGLVTTDKDDFGGAGLGFFMGGVIGLAVGLPIAGARQTIKINGDPELYRQRLPEIERYTVLPKPN